jgi:hypothetical protein
MPRRVNLLCRLFGARESRPSRICRRCGVDRCRRFLFSSSPGLAGPAAHETLLLCGSRCSYGHGRDRNPDRREIASAQQPDQVEGLRLAEPAPGFRLLIPSDRAAPSYQLLDLSLATRPAVFFSVVADILSFEADALLTSFLDNCSPINSDPLDG